MKKLEKIYNIREGIDAHYFRKAIPTKETPKFYIMKDGSRLSKDDCFTDYAKAQKEAHLRNELAIIALEKRIKEIVRIQKKNKKMSK